MLLSLNPTESPRTTSGQEIQEQHCYHYLLDHYPGDKSRSNTSTEVILKYAKGNSCSYCICHMLTKFSYQLNRIGGFSSENEWQFRTQDNTLHGWKINKHLNSSLLVSAVDPSPICQDFVWLHKVTNFCWQERSQFPSHPVRWHEAATHIKQRCTSGKMRVFPWFTMRSNGFSSSRYTSSPFRTLPCSFSWSSLSSPIWIQEATFFSLPSELRFLPLSLPRKLERPFLCPCMETDPHGSLFFFH